MITWPPSPARIDEVSRGGKDNQVPLLTGVHHLTVPTIDPLAASDRYVRVLDFAALLMEERESEVVAVLLQHPCSARLLLRRAASPLAALGGYPLLGLTVASYTELLHWWQPWWIAPPVTRWSSRCPTGAKPTRSPAR